MDNFSKISFVAGIVVAATIALSTGDASAKMKAKYYK
jgi:hypothetical protein